VAGCGELRAGRTNPDGRENVPNEYHGKAHKTELPPHAGELQEGRVLGAVEDAVEAEQHPIERDEGESTHPNIRENGRTKLQLSTHGTAQQRVPVSSGCWLQGSE
jgi:TPP-dependent indolepyruvate ferredoxin oxidoreductase alpha subunit